MRVVFCDATAAELQSSFLFFAQIRTRSVTRFPRFSSCARFAHRWGTVVGLAQSDASRQLRDTVRPGDCKEDGRSCLDPRATRYAQALRHGKEHADLVLHFEGSESHGEWSSLGPVGGRIVGEVFIGLLKADDTSYLAVQPNWTPVLPSATPGEFHMTDLLTFAGAVPPLN